MYNFRNGDLTRRGEKAATLAALVASLRESALESDAMKAAPFHYLHRHAQMMVQLAIYHGDLIPATHCEDCGQPQTFRALNAHHHDYRHPLDVMWLCNVCHGKTHKGGQQTSNGVYLTQGVVLAIEWLKANDPEGKLTVREASMHAGMSTGTMGNAKKYLREHGGES